MERDAFRGHPLTELSISYSRLENHVSLAHIKHTLEELSLYCGNIHYIPKDYFRGCRFLRIVYLSRNHIASLPDLGYISNNLFRMVAWGNHLNNINVLYNVTFPRLDYFTLSDNHVSSFDVTSLMWMPSLRALHISRNNITHLQNPENFITRKRLHSKLHLKLGKNPWHCGNDLSWMLQWERLEFLPPPPDVLVRAFFKNFDIRDMIDVECYTPGNLLGLKLWNMSKSISSSIILIKR